MIVFLLFSYSIFSFNLSTDAHMRGQFSTKKEAESKSFELGCKGVHKNADKWLPCLGEKELHDYLRR